MTRKKILIVEDRPEIRKLVAMAIRELPYELIEAESGDAGLLAVSEHLPDLVLLDVMMPGHLDGLSVCRAIKSDPVLACIPVVMVTALAQESDIEKGGEAGAEDYLVKPFSLVKLKETLNYYIGQQIWGKNP